MIKETVAKLFALGLLTLPSASWGQTSAGEIERCQVIAQEMMDYDDNTRLVFERFCETLFLAAPSNSPPAEAPSGPPKAALPGGESEYFVKCVVDGDPDYIGFRLVTRSQCDEMRGEAAQAGNASAARDFSPKTTAD